MEYMKWPKRLFAIAASILLLSIPLLANKANASEPRQDNQSGCYLAPESNRAECIAFHIVDPQNADLCLSIPISVNDGSLTKEGWTFDECVKAFDE